MRDDNSFDLFWAAVLSKSQRLQIAPPQLPRHRKVPAKLEIGSSTDNIGLKEVSNDFVCNENRLSVFGQF